MIKAVFLDIDGTLYSHKSGQVPPSALQALKQLKGQGVLLFAATGRHMTMIEHLLGNLIPFDGYVSLNGQICLDQEKRVLYDNPISPSDTAVITELFSSKTVPIALLEEKRRYINFASERVESILRGFSSFVPPTDVYRGGRVYQAVGYFDHATGENLLSSLTSCRFVRWNPFAIDIIPASGGKMTGIQKLLEHYRLSPEEIIAFGDGDNDQDMLAFAGIGVAMGNAEECAKEAADYVTTDIDAEGIVHALKHFRLL